MTEEILHFAEPTVRTFLDYSFIFGIRKKGASDYDKFIYGNYGGLCFVHSLYNEIYDPFDLFPGPRVRQLIKVGALEARGHDLWREAKVEMFSIIDFLAEQIGKGFYLLATLDEFFLIGKASYKRVHFIHHNLVIGIDKIKKEVSLAGYFRLDGADYGIQRISFDCFEKAFSFKSHLLQKQQGQELFALTSYRYLVALRIASEFTYEFLPATLLNILESYLNASVSDEQLNWHNKDMTKLKASYGVSIYEKLWEHTKMMLDGEAIANLHEMRLLTEHKSLMLERLRYAVARGFAPNDRNSFEELEKVFQLAKTVRLKLYLEFQSPGNKKDVGDEVCKALQLCCDRERRCYERVIKTIILHHRY